MPATSTTTTSWHRLPAELRLTILDFLVQDGCSLAGCATVSREWQAAIERHTFARICVTPARLADFDAMTRRSRARVRYIWLCVELAEYDCPVCEVASSILSTRDDRAVTRAIERLFAVLSTWDVVATGPGKNGKTGGGLLLDISVHSPSDNQHRFKELTFGPDLAFGDVRDDRRWRARLRKAFAPPSLSTRKNSGALYNRVHNLTRRGPAALLPEKWPLSRVFGQILAFSPFVRVTGEEQWWRSLPLVPAVTRVLLRQQTRRRWKPESLSQLFSRLPRLTEIHYEPWREWRNALQDATDEFLLRLFRSLASSSKLRTLVLIENFVPPSPQYPRPRRARWRKVRTPTPDVSQALAHASLALEHLAASYLVDASLFFDSLLDDSQVWTWPNLTSLALTSRLLTPDARSDATDNLFLAAAAAAMRMPKLKTMEIWNGQRGLAMVFRYESKGGGQPATLTCRGTWELGLGRPVIRAWAAVAAEQRSLGVVAVTKVIVAGAAGIESMIKSHGDAIHHLQLRSQVIRPVSLLQIQMEPRIRETLYTRPSGT